MNKTDRKNKTNLNVIWPTNGGYFTVTDLLAANPSFIMITLRVRLDKALKKDKTVSVIGYKNSGKGRPKMILAMNPVTQALLDKAYNQDGIQPPEVKPIVNVMDVTSTPIPTSETVSNVIGTPVNIPVSTESAVAAS